MNRRAILLVLAALVAPSMTAPTFAASPEEAVAAEPPRPTIASRFDGTSRAPSAGLAVWRQIALELRELIPIDLTRALRDALLEGAEPDVIPIAVVDLRYPIQLFVAVPLRDRTHRGEVAFTLDRERWLPRSSAPAWITLDCGDGAGQRPVRIGDRIAASYTTVGAKQLVLRAGDSPASHKVARFEITVEALDQPCPDDTLRVVASLPYEGAAAAGRAYVYLGAGHTRVERPIVVPEGFDLSNDQNADELYALLDRQGLAARMRALGFDLVILNFDDATDYVQRNAFVLVSLLQRVQAELPPDRDVAVVGPSIGGVIGRYALAWMESHDVPHRVRALVTLDAPHLGANVPLGLQHWFAFFADVSATAEFIVDRLHRPAAKQILLEHQRWGLAAARGPDPLRDRLLAELDELGWPQQPRRVAIANGGGTGTGQGFAPGALLLRYEHRTFVRRLKGHVWALPDHTPGVIFDGHVAFFVPLKDQTVVVHGTEPLDDSPGGYRNTLLQIDTTAVPYGDIVAVVPGHCFVPTVSALALDLSLRQDLRAVPDLAAHSPFDTVYFPAANQEHVELTAENSAWFERELTAPATAGAAVSAIASIVEPAPRPLTVTPNPFSGATNVRFRLATPGRARLTVLDLAGRMVTTLADGMRAAGTHEVAWAGDARSRIPPGVYVLALEIGGLRHTLRVTRID